MGWDFCFTRLRTSVGFKPSITKHGEDYELFWFRIYIAAGRG
jgi:hypothetical protein